MRWFLALMLSCLPLAAQAQEAKPVDLAIVVSLDRSESIDADEAKAQIDGLVYTLRHSNFRDTVAVGWYGSIGLTVLTWSSFGRSEVILPWTSVADRGDAAAAAKFLELDYARQIFAPHGSQTDLAFAIEIGMNQLDELPWPATRSVINVVADGISNIGRLPMIDRNIALERGITINGLVMARGSAIEVVSRYFEREVIGGPLSFVQVSEGTHDFANAMLRKIVREMVRLRAPTVSAKDDTG